MAAYNPFRDSWFDQQARLVPVRTNRTANYESEDESEAKFKSDCISDNGADLEFDNFIEGIDEKAPLESWESMMGDELEDEEFWREEMVESDSEAYEEEDEKIKDFDGVSNKKVESVDHTKERPVGMWTSVGAIMEISNSMAGASIAKRRNIAKEECKETAIDFCQLYEEEKKKLIGFLKELMRRKKNYQEKLMKKLMKELVKKFDEEIDEEIDEEMMKKLMKKLMENLMKNYQRNGEGSWFEMIDPILGW